MKRIIFLSLFVICKTAYAQDTTLVVKEPKDYKILDRYESNILMGPIGPDLNTIFLDRKTPLDSTFQRIDCSQHKEDCLKIRDQLEFFLNRKGGALQYAPIERRADPTGTRSSNNGLIYVKFKSYRKIGLFMLYESITDYGTSHDSHQSAFTLTFYGWLCEE